jgi:hypothetical protein
MKLNPLHFLAVATSMLCLTATAGPLLRTDVAADPVWLVHVDCDLLRPTGVGKYILGEMEKPEAQAKLGAFQTMFNLDLRTQLHALTLYNTGELPQDGVLLVYAAFDSARLVTLAKGANDYKSTTHGEHVIHNWIDDKKKAVNGVKPRTYAAIFGNRVIVFGQKETSVAVALDVMDRVTPNLSSNASGPAFGALNAPSFIQASARKMNLPASDPNAAVLKMSKQARFELGEAEQQVSAILSLDANDEEVAGHLLSIGQGIVALMKLQKTKPENAKLAEAMVLRQDGAKMTAICSLPAGEVIEMMKADAARKAAAKSAKD